mmetsp:Transcript_22926/g.22235  ORF Transcript_22926/g.22235 Transcript_22926/m.22235 type:complete len:148 (+) Transcript_22926:797-1240(+)
MSIHSKNIIHRDIKTQNIFITKENILKIGDFGISRQVESSNPFAETQKGTPYFMPPEVCLGKPYDSKADVWAVGIILYELITFKKPYESEVLTELFKKIVRDPFEPIPLDSHTNLQLLINVILNKDYNKRPNINDLARIPIMKKFIL